MTELFKNKTGELDSFEKMALAFTQKFGTKFLSRVEGNDVDEMAVEFARLVAPYLNENAGNFKIYPLSQKDDYRKGHGSGGAVDTQIRVKSGRMYLVGFNYGA